MHAHARTLTDVDHDIWLDALHLTASELGDAGGQYSVRKRTLRGGLRDGVDLVEIHNGLLRFAVLPTRGMGLWKAWLGDWTIGWQAPLRGPVHPRFVPQDEASGIGWLGGFDEWLCRCGLASNGAPEFNAAGALVHPLHGRIANLPAHRVELLIDPATRAIALVGEVEESRLFGPKLRLRSTVSTGYDEPTIRIIDEVANLSSEPGEFELLYHINFGPPLLGPGATVHAPVQTLAPRDAHSAGDVNTWNTFGPPRPGLAEYAHFLELASDAAGRTRVLLEAADGARGASLRFDRRELPCFTLWKSQRAGFDGYVTGLEPGVNFPNVRSFEREQGRVVSLGPGESRRFELELAIHATAASVAAERDAIAAIARHGDSRVHIRPHTGWSAG